MNQILHHLRVTASCLFLLVAHQDVSRAGYDPTLGRWLSRDPIEESGGLNLYGYVENDPTDLIDGDGMQSARPSANRPGSGSGFRGGLIPEHLVPPSLRPFRIEIGRFETERTARMYNWARPETLADHFARHGRDFNASCEREYARMAEEFLRESQRNGYPTTLDPKGVIRTFDPATMRFGAYNADGSTRTFFAPNSNTYFSGQPGLSPTIIGSPSSAPNRRVLLTR